MMESRRCTEPRCVILKKAVIPMSSLPSLSPPRTGPQVPQTGVLETPPDPRLLEHPPPPEAPHPWREVQRAW